MEPQKNSSKSLRTASSPSCLEIALGRLEERAIKESTYKNYLGTLRRLNLEEFPFEKLTPRILSQKLQTILTESTRRKHAINLRACLGIKVPSPRIRQKEYDLPSVEDTHETFRESHYRIQAFTMLYAGARVGEAAVKQPIKGNVIMFDRQMTADNEILPPKSSGPVVVPDWFADEYRNTDPKDFKRHPYTLYKGITRRSVKYLGAPVNPHQLRHLFATQLVDMGASPRVLQAQMRHSNVTVSLKYYVHTRQQDISDLMNRFGGVK